MQRVRLSLFFLLFLLSCEKEERPNLINLPEFFVPIDLNDLQVGQMNRYLVLEAAPALEDLSYEYNGDTLLLEVVSSANENFILEERLTKYSPSYQSEDPCAIRSYEFEIRNDSLTISKVGQACGYSWIFDTLPKSIPLMKNEEVETRFVDWQLDLVDFGQDGIATGYLEDFELFDLIYPHLNAYVNNAEMAFDGNGVTLVYSRGHGIVRSIIFNGFSRSGTGVDLLTATDEE